MSAKTRAVELLNALQAAIDSIPPGVVAGTRHGLLAKCLTPTLSDDDPPVEIFPYDIADGAYKSFSTQWECVFQAKSISEPLSAKFPLVLQDVTLEFSKKGVPTICKVLPLYKLMETKLAELADEYELEEFNIARALRAGSEKAKQYVGNALISDYPLLGAVLHPAIRLAFFETSDWDSEIPKRAHSLLMALVKKYSNSTTATSAHGSKPAKGIFAMAVKGHTEMKKKRRCLQGKMKLTCISVGFRRSRMASTIHLGGGSKTKAPFRRLHALQETLLQSRGRRGVIEQQQATLAHIEQVRMLIMGMEQRLQTQEDKLIQSVEWAESEGRYSADFFKLLKRMVACKMSLGRDLWTSKKIRRHFVEYGKQLSPSCQAVLEGVYLQDRPVVIGCLSGKLGTIQSQAKRTSFSGRPWHHLSVSQPTDHVQ
ncbi:hypothetical protein B0H14DRAFT_2575792 [Mycena olivaceomarginata]|nr:hypothetical protein B0H14DRAFT_2575792 [Mycena olivaceomarginata]